MSEISDSQLLQRINAFPLSDSAAEVSFASKLADENFWTLGHATQVEQEYRRFLYLTQVAGHKVCPSKDVDAAWHLHLTQTASYQRLCADVLREFLHHSESKGGDTELSKHRHMYRETLASYKRLFAEAPPSGIWPDMKRRFALAQPNRPEASWKWPFALEYGANWTLVFALVPIVLGTLCAVKLGWAVVPDMTGPAFLRLYVLLLAAVVASFELHQWVAQQAIQETNAVDAYEAAWLCGGKRRMFSTALASLVKRGLLLTTVVKSRKRERPTFKKRIRDAVDIQTLPPIEQICLSAMPDSSFSLKTMTAIVRGKADVQRDAGDAARAVQFRLENAGMIHRHGEVAAPFGALMLFLGLLLTAAVVRFAHGVQVFHPVGFLALLIVASIVVMGFYLRHTVAPTANGRKVIAQLKAANAPLKRNTAEGLPLFALGFALFGVSSVSADPGFDTFKRVLGNHPGTTGSGGGCSGGGCGGGGCGGGGCGG